MQQFRARETFNGEINGRISRYVEGRMYNLKEDNEVLKAECAKWEVEGKIEMVESVKSLKTSNGLEIAAEPGRASGTLET